MLTSKKYPHSAGHYCPACLSDNITPDGDFFTEGTQVGLDCRCLDCSAAWAEIYSLQGYSSLTTADQPSSTPEDSRTASA